MTVAAATELWRLSATELAETIRSGQASSKEVVEAHLQRIESVNAAINAVVIVRAELPPLHGVPFTVKDNIDVVGTPTTQGLRAVQVIGPRYREDLCFDAALAIEERLGIFTPIHPR